MNIKEAKEQIKYAMTAYFSKDELGNYEIPMAKQRPVFLIGAPGIGKTAIMEQIAQELGVLLVSYSMTHHTRQSALGLPYITDKAYGDETFRVSEYTMSEIIASVYDAMEATGLKEGILFLDEINCVSETLTPSMLQFLQFKTFGRHALPEGWLVVTAGNPPEYNRAVREFDIVTMDRLKKITVEPDFDVWKEYAYQRQIHPGILSYLEIKKNNFYHVETGVGGKNFVTARGWDDLSQMIRLCEKKELPVNGKLISQYLQDGKIASDFSAYYDLFRKYKSDYQIETILSGKASDKIRERAANGRFDERIALIGLLMDAVSEACRQTAEQEDYLVLVLQTLKHYRSVSSGAASENSATVVKNPASASDIAESRRSSTDSPLKYETSFHIYLYDAVNASGSGKNESDRLRETLSLRSRAGTLSLSERRTLQLAIGFFQTCMQNGLDFDGCKEAYRKEASQLQEQSRETSEKLSNAFAFIEEVFPQGQEMLIFVTELTVNEITSRFISHYGCEPYYLHSKDLMFYERNKEIASRMAALEL